MSVNTKVFYNRVAEIVIKIDYKAYMKLIGF